MTNWVAVKWIPPLFAAFNTVFPHRDKSSDGTIGDAAHQLETSSHNPDDTLGVKAEYTDADNVPEVRAADVDATLRDAILTMQDIVDVIAVSAERARFKYIIYNRHIWRKSNGFARETYSGSDPHTSHAHFSGDPSYDEDGRPFTSILGMRPAMTTAIPGAYDDYFPDTVMAILVGQTPRFGYPALTGPEWDNDTLENHTVQKVEERLMTKLTALEGKVDAIGTPVPTAREIAVEIIALLSGQ